MQIERGRYSYVEGEAGIPFDELFERFIREGELKTVIKGGSGEDLYVEVDKDFIYVSAMGNSGRHMEAAVDCRDTASFSLNSRTYDKNGKLSGPHLDMFAGKFVESALSFFKDNGINIKACQGHWKKGSFNRNQLEEGMRVHGDLVRAAKETWSGKLFVSLGFSELNSQDIDWENRDSNLDVSAVFRKPEY